MIRADDYVVEIRDVNLYRHGVIDPASLDLELILARAEVGKWTLRLPADNPKAALLCAEGMGIVVTGPEGPLASGPMTAFKRTTSAEYPRGLVVVTGVTDEILLKDAACYPKPESADPEAQRGGYDELELPVETMMLRLVDQNVGPGAAPGRRATLASYITLAPDLGRGVTAVKAIRFKNLLTTLVELAQLDPTLRFQVVQEGDRLVFRVHDVRDLTATIRLDVANNGLDSEELSLWAPDVTFPIVLGAGERDDQIIQTLQTDAAKEAETKWGRRIESVISQAQTTNPQELDNSALEALNESGFTGVATTVVPAETTTMRFGHDFGFDKITLVLAGQESTSIVSQAMLRIRKNQVGWGLGVGDISGYDPASRQERAISKLVDRVDAIERVTPIAGLDTVAPPPPSMPILTSRAGTLTATWDGFTHDGGVMPADFDRCDVWCDGAVVGSVTATQGTNFVSIAGLDYLAEHTVYLTALDTSGNQSGPSVAAGTTVAQVVDTDIIDQAITEAKIAVGAISERLLDAELAGDLTKMKVDIGDAVSEASKALADAADAAAKAIAAESAAGKAGEDAAKAITDAAAAATTANSAETIAEAANTAASQAVSDAAAAMSSAASKSTITYSIKAPTSADRGTRVGDMWWVRDATTGQITAQYEWDGTTWQARTLANAVIANLDAGKLTSGYIDADRIQASTISASKLVIASGRNLVVNGDFSQTDPKTLSWQATPGTAVVTGGGQSGNALRITGTGAQIATANRPGPLACEPGAAFRLFLRVKASAAIPAGAIRFYAEFATSTGAKSYGFCSAPALNAGAWTEASAIVTAPATCSQVQFVIAAYAALPAGVTADVDYVGAWPAATGELIVDGSITAAKVAARSITAEKLVLASGRNLIVNGDFTVADPASCSWTATGQNGVVVGAGRTGNAYRMYGQGTKAIGSYNMPYPVPCEPGTVFRLFVRVKTSTPLTVANQVGVYVAFKTLAGVTTWQHAYLPVSAAGVWVETQGMVTAPAGCVEVTFAITTRGGFTGYADFDQVAAWPAATGQLIVDGSITAAKITAGAIVTDKLAAGAVTADKIKARTITGDLIAGRTITASNLAIGDFENLIEAANFEEEAYRAEYRPFGYLGRYTQTIVHEGRWAIEAIPHETVGARDWIRLGGPFAVQPGEEIYLSFWAYRQSASQPIKLVLKGFAAAGYWETGQDIELVAPVTAQVNQWVFYEGHGVVGDWNEQMEPVLAFPQGAMTGSWFIDQVQARRMAAGHLIVDGAITAGKIAAEAVTARTIAAEAITAGKIAAGVITANELAAGSVLAKHIVAETITGDKLVAQSITGAKIAALTIEAGHLAANSITAGKIAANAITTNQLAADAITSKHSITGALIQTTADASRGVKITSDGLQAWDLWGNRTLNVDASTGAVSIVGNLQAGDSAAAAIVSKSVRMRGGTGPGLQLKDSRAVSSYSALGLASEAGSYWSPGDTVLHSWSWDNSVSVLALGGGGSSVRLVTAGRYDGIGFRTSDYKAAVVGRLVTNQHRFQQANFDIVALNYTGLSVIATVYHPAIVLENIRIPVPVADSVSSWMSSAYAYSTSYAQVRFERTTSAGIGRAFIFSWWI